MIVVLLDKKGKEITVNCFGVVYDMPNRLKLYSSVNDIKAIIYLNNYEYICFKDNENEEE